MASLYNNFLSIFFFLFLINPFPIHGKSFRPKQLVIPVTKDPSTKQYLTTIQQRTPLVSVNLTVDLGGPNLWTECERFFVSSSYEHARCGSAVCKLPSKKTICLLPCFMPANTPRCYTDLCGFLAQNPISGTTLVNAEIGQDVVSVQSINGSYLGQVVSVSKFIFTCADSDMLYRLADHARGVAGLGRNKISLPYQFSSAFSFHKKFALCLSPNSNGFVIFGDGPYVLQPNIDVAKSLIYTRLIRNHLNPGNVGFFDDDPSPDYYIGIHSIKVNDNIVPLNKTLLKINKNGLGGTKISTVNHYTLMHSAIYNAFINVFTKELADVPRVPAVAPFGVCYNSTFIGSTRAGPSVPTIDLVLQNSKAFWRIFGSNSMVKVKEDVLCLGFVQGSPDASITIGGHQLEDNLLQFDLETSKLGFSSSLLLRQTTCANFNFS